MPIKEIKAKSMLTKSNVPGMDYCVNPYIGCIHGCVYCYARFMRRFTGHFKDDWGTFCDVRINAPEILEKQLSGKRKKGFVWVGSVTDPYQPAEKKYMITRRILEILAKHKWQFAVQTKSDLILRDLDFFKKYKKAEIGVTINTLDEKFRKRLEPGIGTTVDRKLKILKKFHEAGIKNLYVFIGPVFPYITEIEAVFEKVAPYADQIFVETLNVKAAAWKNIEKFLQRYYPNLVDNYQKIFFADFGKRYWKNVEKRVKKLGSIYKVKNVFIIHGK